ncbi:hypothetical protein F4811DRAFT_512342 [Daldinia bambusicola]|nr:hypothetical protein F4811DRAFT_512342 [Daldinia bambusicola]
MVMLSQILSNSNLGWLLLPLFTAHRCPVLYPQSNHGQIKIVNPCSQTHILMKVISALDGMDAFRDVADVVATDGGRHKLPYTTWNSQYE